MIYLVLAVLSSTMVSVVMRLSTGKVKNNMSMLAANYLVCTLLSAVNAGGNLLTPPEALPGTVGMGIVNGALYLIAFLLLHYNMKRNGVVLASTFMKLGLLVSMAVSVIFFQEVPGVVQWIGFAIAVGAIILINYEKGSGAASGSQMWLIILLLVAGVSDSLAKVFEAYGDTAYSGQFFVYTFLTALVLCVILVLKNGEKPNWKEIGFGLVLGIPNFFSARLLLKSLEHLPGVLVYPTVSVAIILMVTMIGMVFFKEKLKPRQLIGLTAILAALVMLNL
ncbi:MAG: DMT family transporter [Oscillospiraceae bacterium]|nr:DMT family transporter [Oscillospiraceae bacterium]